MTFSEEEDAFIQKRRKLVAAWPIVGLVLLGSLVVLGGWLVISKPLLANPFFVMTGLSSDSIPPSMLTLMAGLLPVVVLLCLLLSVTCVAFAFAAFANERRYLTILSRHMVEQQLPPPGPLSHTVSRQGGSSPPITSG